MHQVGEFDGVLNEKDGNVVADQVKNSLVGIKFHSKAAHVAGQVGGAARTDHGGEADEDGCLALGVGEKARASQILERFVDLKYPVGSRASGVNYALGDALVVKMSD